MIVVAIIGILAAIAIPGFQKYIRRSRMAEAPQMLKNIVDLEIVYYDTEVVDAATLQITDNSYAVGTGTERMPLLADIIQNRALTDWKSTAPFNDIEFYGPEFVYASYGVTGSGSTPETSIDISALFDLGDDDCTSAPAYNVYVAPNGCKLYVTRLEILEGFKHTRNPVIVDEND